jgi:subtilisin family serine protease
MRFRSLGALGASVGVAALVVTSAFGVAGGQSKDRTTSQKAHASAATYIVQMADDPAVAYEGGVAGIKGTAPAKGQKLNPNSNDVKKYVAYLNGKHADAAAAVGAEKFYDYTYSFNGFAAKMSEAQATKLASLSGVMDVSKDVLMQPTTSTSPTFLGLDAADGLWQKAGGVSKAGENVIVGIVDTGIWPEHPSFSDQKDLSFQTGESGKRNLAYGPAPEGWTGTCQSGEQFSQDHCNNKLIGARYYLSGFGHFGVFQYDYKSARDADSHGSHTSSTAAGNHGVPATGAAASFGRISGMAPRARIAAYKVCWNGDAGGCASSDSVAAIDQAVADGVDVINFSISGTSTNFLDPVEVAFLFASKAGVFVAASAGNSGPGASTVAHPSPWLTTVAASTQARASEAKLTLGNEKSYTGASSNTTPTTGPVVLSSAVGAAGAPASSVALCFLGTLDPAKVAGKIVVCDRGVNARIEKSQEVQRAGGKGMILVNTSPNSLNADLHYVPTIHVDDVAGADVKAYVTSAGASATATIGAVSGAADAPKMAAFSSRGPLLGAGGDLLKPDVSAPGVDILAAVSPDSGRSFDLLSGTSMSSPHVAGLGALLRQAHPDWSPAAIKSALMTTGYPTLDGDEFAHGAGHVKPNAATDPGLVYDAGFDDYRAFLRSQGLCTQCGVRISPLPPAAIIDPSDLNLASIAIGDLAGVQTVTRTVTNVGPAGTYNVSVTPPAGVSVSVNPTSLTLAAGAKASYTVTFTRTTAPFDAYVFGSLTWTNGTHSVRSPLVINPVGAAAPRSQTGTGTSGEFKYNVRSGFTGTMKFEARGLLAATEAAGNVVDDPANNFDTSNPTANQGITVHDLVAPAVTTHARFSLFDENVDGPGTSDDIDLYVYRVDPDGPDAGTAPDLVHVGTSGSGTSQEEVNVSGPGLVAGATYKVFVHGWQTDGPDANYTLFSWFLGAYGAGSNLTLPAPLDVNIGQTYPITIGYSGLTSGKRYLGTVRYLDGTTQAGATFLAVNS